MTSFRALGPQPLVTLMKIERAEASDIDLSFLLYGGGDVMPTTGIELKLAMSEPKRGKQK